MLFSEAPIISYTLELSDYWIIFRHTHQVPMYSRSITLDQDEIIVAHSANCPVLKREQLIQVGFQSMYNYEAVIEVLNPLIIFNQAPLQVILKNLGPEKISLYKKDTAIKLTLFTQ